MLLASLNVFVVVVVIFIVILARGAIYLTSYAASEKFGMSRLLLAGRRRVGEMLWKYFACLSLPSIC